MKRLLRTFIFSLLATLPALSLANETLDYTPGLIEKELSAQHTVLVIYASDWCITCIRQERIIKKLRAANREYDKQITFIRVDWNDYGDADVTTKRNIVRRSSLLLLRGEEELGRLIAATNKSVIKELLDKGLE